MSEPEPKRARTDEAPYEIIYWPGLPGRGEFIRLLFEEAGVPYTDHSQEETAVQDVLDLITPDKGPDAAGSTNPPTLAPPMLRHGDLLIHQMPNILLYLAPRLGLAPKEGNGVYHLNQIVLTLNDCFVNELHDTHHPISVSKYYDDQKAEAKLRAKSFTDERIPKFLAWVQRVIKSKASGDGPWLYGGQFTYADIFLFQCLHGTTFAFPKTLEKLRKSGDYDDVFKLYDAVEERPNIKAYMASKRRQAYGDGIWRHYPELEEGIE